MTSPDEILSLASVVLAPLILQPLPKHAPTNASGHTCVALWYAPQADVNCPVLPLCNNIILWRQFCSGHCGGGLMVELDDDLGDFFQS